MKTHNNFSLWARSVFTIFGFLIFSFFTWANDCPKGTAYSAKNIGEFLRTHPSDKDREAEPPKVGKGPLWQNFPKARDTEFQDCMAALAQEHPWSEMKYYIMPRQESRGDKVDEVARAYAKVQHAQLSVYEIRELAQLQTSGDAYDHVIKSFLRNSPTPGDVARRFTPTEFNQLLSSLKSVQDAQGNPDLERAQIISGYLKDLSKQITPAEAIKFAEFNTRADTYNLVLLEYAQERIKTSGMTEAEVNELSDSLKDLKMDKGNLIKEREDETSIRTLAAKSAVATAIRQAWTKQKNDSSKRPLSDEPTGLKPLPTHK